MERIGTYRVGWKGRLISVEARVVGNAVSIYSYREIHPHGYVVSSREDRNGGPRGGRTDHEFPDDDTHLGEGDYATALATWSEEDRLALARLVRARARARD